MRLSNTEPTLRFGGPGTRKTPHPFTVRSFGLTVSDSTLLAGPWDVTLNDQGNHAQVFVSNVLSGTVTRIDLKIPHTGAPIVETMPQIASGYVHLADPNALEIRPTGLAFVAGRDVLYVASTGDNAIFAVSNADMEHDDDGMDRNIFDVGCESSGHRFRPHLEWADGISRVSQDGSMLIW